MGNRKSFSRNEASSGQSDRRLVPRTNAEHSIVPTLPIPEQLQEWFPPQNAQKNVRKLFEWHGEIGRGVTGSIHSVSYRRRSCALKRIDRNDKSAFITEVEILSKLQHRGIIGYIDVFLDEKYFYLLLERADSNLHQMIQTTGPFDEARTKTITKALLESLAYVHSKNISHCDLKPTNIMFTTDDRTTPKLIDFGDAKRISEKESYIELSDEVDSLYTNVDFM